MRVFYFKDLGGRQPYEAPPRPWTECTADEVKAMMAENRFGATREKPEPIKVTSDELIEEVVISQASGEITTKLIRMWIAMADRILKNPNYAGFPERQEMVYAALEDLFENGLNIELRDKTNPNLYAYYSSMITRSAHAYVQRMKNESERS